MGLPSRGFPCERAKPWQIAEDKVKGKAIETVNLKTYIKTYLSTPRISPTVVRDAKNESWLSGVFSK